MICILELFICFIDLNRLFFNYELKICYCIQYAYIYIYIKKSLFIQIKVLTLVKYCVLHPGVWVLVSYGLNLFSGFLFTPQSKGFTTQNLDDFNNWPRFFLLKCLKRVSVQRSKSIKKDCLALCTGISGVISLCYSVSTLIIFPFKRSAYVRDSQIVRHFTDFAEPLTATFLPYSQNLSKHATIRSNHTRRISRGPEGFMWTTLEMCKSFIT